HPVTTPVLARPVRRNYASVFAKGSPIGEFSLVNHRTMSNTFFEFWGNPLKFCGKPIWGHKPSLPAPPSIYGIIRISEYSIEERERKIDLTVVNYMSDLERRKGGRNQ
ncbi:hypothetical protein EV207_14130, partial [Scopulibacillus darangshiensis]